MKFYEVSLADGYKKLLEVYPEIENKVKNLLEGENGWYFGCNVPVMNCITNYVDEVWVSRKMFNVRIFEKTFYVAAGYPLKKIINDEDLDAENWKSFQESCREQWDDGADFILVDLWFCGYKSQITIPKKYIFRLD